MDSRLRCVLGDSVTVRYPLGVVHYTTLATPPVVRGGTPELSVHVARDGGDRLTEVWTTGRAVRAGRRGDLVYSHDGEYLFCAGRVEPAAVCAGPVRAAYLRAFTLLAELGYRHVFRIWNFIGRINEANAEGLERYRDFCRGRAEAFDDSPLAMDPPPAGTGVGAHTDGVSFYLLARRTQGHLAVENDRQVPAYRYPRRYGPRPPGFSRAVLLSPDGGLCVSGTASILGHETVHRGDVVAQCTTTLANLAALPAPGTVARDGPRRPPLDLATLRAVKVYVRRRSDIAAVRDLCARVLSPAAEVAFFPVDLCRAELLVEIEAVAPVRRDGRRDTRTPGHGADRGTREVAWATSTS